MDSDLVLPVIDGLDEMDPGTAPGYTSRAADRLRSINRFERGGAHCPFVDVPEAAEKLGLLLDV
ncbi:hypothetical protein ACIRPZ_23315 [Streptomyces anulatus]